MDVSTALVVADHVSCDDVSHHYHNGVTGEDRIYKALNRALCNFCGLPLETSFGTLLLEGEVIDHIAFFGTPYDVLECILPIGTYREEMGDLAYTYAYDLGIYSDYYPNCMKDVACEMEEYFISSAEYYDTHVSQMVEEDGFCIESYVQDLLSAQEYIHEYSKTGNEPKHKSWLGQEVVKAFQMVYDGPAQYAAALAELLLRVAGESNEEGMCGYVSIIPRLGWYQNHKDLFAKSIYFDALEKLQKRLELPYRNTRSAETDVYYAQAYNDWSYGCVVYTDNEIMDEERIMYPLARKAFYVLLDKAQSDALTA